MPLALEYVVPIIKFASIMLGGVSGILALLVDFKDKEGRITRWGRLALWGVVISFILSAIMQTIEIYKDRQAAKAEAERTHQFLSAIERGIYNLAPDQMSFELSLEESLDSPYLRKYGERLKAFAKAYEHKAVKLPKGTQCYCSPLDNGREKVDGFIIDRRSPLFPDPKAEPEAWKMIAQMEVSVSIYKRDSLVSPDTLTTDKANLFFNTISVSTELSVMLTSHSVEIVARNMRPNSEDFQWHNQGGIESLLDMANATVSIFPRDNLSEDYTPLELGISKATKIQMITFNSNGRMFNCNQPCKTSGDYPEYYFRMPSDVSKTSLNMSCH
jgi:hypothetical protein